VHVSGGLVAELPWLAEPWSRVARALESGRMPAGLLIVGRAGLGCARLAEAIARALLCADPAPDASACGRCAACREMDAGAHPDCLSVGLLEDKTQILIEQIRDLTAAMALTAGEKGVRCAIVSPADKLGTPAANALLKTLEEPPPGATLILVAESPTQLPATVVSRCLRLAVPLPEGEAALAWLDQHAGRSDWPLLLALSGGAPLAAVRLAEEAGDDLHARLAGLLDAAAGPRDPLAVAAEFAAWPLERVAVWIAWLAWAMLRAGTTGAGVAWWPPEIATLGARADKRRLADGWREATRVANDSAVLNAALARERLVLLFIEAFDRRRGQA
jgi:DNA polymerase-3 subunit delta'